MEMSTFEKIIFRRVCLFGGREAEQHSHLSSHSHVATNDGNTTFGLAMSRDCSPVMVWLHVNQVLISSQETRCLLDLRRETVSVSLRVMIFNLMPAQDLISCTKIG